MVYRVDFWVIVGGVVLLALIIRSGIIEERREVAKARLASVPADRAEWSDIRSFLSATFVDTNRYIDLPGWSAATSLKSIADSGRDLDATIAVVVYGSAVRRDRSARDIDVCWITAGDANGVKSLRAEATWSIDDGYGAITRRTKALHVAVVSEAELASQVRENTEWATTLLLDGVLLAGPTTILSGPLVYAWRRVFAVRRPPHWNCEVLTPVPLRDSGAIALAESEQP